MALAIPIITEFDNKGISSAIREFKNLESASDKIGFAAQKAAKVAELGFLALGAAGLAVAGFLYKAAEAAAEDQAAQVKLESQIRATVKVSDAQVASIEKFIDMTQRAVGVSDDSLRPAYGRLLGAVKDVREAQDLLNLALDLSAVTGKSVEITSLAIARAQEGAFGPLDKLGLGYEKGEIKARGFKDTIKDLEARFEGAALKKAETYEGVMARLKITLQELQESIGQKVLPIIQELTEAALKIAQAFGEKGAAGGIQELRTQLLSLGTDTDGTLNLFGKFYDKLASIINGIMNAIAIPVSVIRFLTTGNFDNFTMPGLPTFAQLSKDQNASPGFTSARQFESLMPKMSSGAGGGTSFTMPTKVPKSVSEPPVSAMPSGTGSRTGGFMDFAGITINLDAGLISSPATIGQDIIDAILAAQRDSGVVFQPAGAL